MERIGDSGFRSIFFLIFYLFQFSAFSQAVKNDSIAYRIKLPIDSLFYKSSTAYCTVEWDCVNQNDLRKSVTFHNDQWFSFRPLTEGTHYLNVKNQICKDSRGIQLLVIEGKVCQPDTYNYLKLHSQLSVVDIYYRLENLQINREYFICVDGLLGDFCSFNIAISTTPPDYAVLTRTDEIKDSPLSSRNNVVSFDWSINTKTNDTLRKFLVTRKIADENMKVIKEIDIPESTHRSETMYFQITDTLKQSELYQYTVIGETQTNKKYVFHRYHYNNYLKPLRNNAYSFYFKSPFKGKDKIVFQIFDRNSEKFIRSYIMENTRKKTYEINLSNYVNSGVKNFKVVISLERERENKLEKFISFGEKDY